MEKTDEKLIADILDGSHDALKMLINRHLKNVYNFAYRLCGNAKDAEDIAQETFIKMWRKINTYRTNENFKTWLLSIARNTTIDMMRKRKTLAFTDFENTKDENILTDTLKDPEPLPDILYTHIENKKLLEGFLQQLSVIHREILLLHYQEQLTFGEIGLLLKKPLHTVKSRHWRALKVLRELMEQ